MKKLLILTFTMVVYLQVNAQIVFKTEYLGKSSYRMAEGNKDEKVGDAKGSAMVYQGGVNIPLSMRINENNQPTMWSVNAGGAYAKLSNKNFTDPLVIDEIMNLGLSINHLRPLNHKWSILMSLGGGVYMPTTQLSQMRFKNMLANVGTIFICRINPNLELGGGIAMNNSFGFPMVFPTFYLNWILTGQYSVNVSLMNGLEVSAGYNFNDNLSLNIVAQMDGQMALLEQDGQDKIFSHQYIIAGFRPEIKIGKNILIPITAGISAMRPTEMMNRKLNSLFQDRGYYFQISPYASVGIEIGF